MGNEIKKIIYMLMVTCIMAGITAFAVPEISYADDYSGDYTEDYTDDYASGGLMYVYDYSGILSETQLNTLENKAADISATYNSGTYIVIIPDYHSYGSGVVNAAENIYTSMNFGYGSDNNGEVLLLSMDDRDYSFTVKGYAANEAFNEYARGVVEDAFLDDFHDDDWFNGLNDYLDKSSELLKLAADGHPLTRESSPGYILANWGVSLLLGIMIALIIGLMIKGTMKSVAAKVEARNYVKDGSLDISYRNDYFKYSTETRRKIEKSSSSSDSSGGGFSSSSGKF